MARSLAVFSATWPGVPLIYSGQEIGNRKRIQFFEKDTILSGPDAESFSALYSSLLQLKMSNPALRSDSSASVIRLQTSAPGQVLAFLRIQERNSVLVVLNLSTQADLHFEIVDPRLSGRYRNLYSGATNDFRSDKSFEMQPWEYLIYTAE
jgi:1,4-alpha-glucan branching enzyme